MAGFFKGELLLAGVGSSNLACCRLDLKHGAFDRKAGGITTVSCPKASLNLLQSPFMVPQFVHSLHNSTLNSKDDELLLHDFHGDAKLLRKGLQPLRIWIWRAFHINSLHNAEGIKLM
jgi:hypothetical protein